MSNQVKGGLYVCVRSHDDYGFRPTTDHPVNMLRGMVMFFDEEPDLKYWRGLSLSTCSDSVTAQLDKIYCPHKKDGWGPPFPKCEECQRAITPWSEEEARP